MNVAIEHRSALSWSFGGAAVALAVAAIATQQAHLHLWGAIVSSRRSFTDGAAIAQALGVAMRGIWSAGVIALLLGGAAYFLGQRGTRARWLALAGIGLVCLALWLVAAYEHSLRWS